MAGLGRVRENRMLTQFSPHAYVATVPTKSVRTVLQLCATCSEEVQEVLKRRNIASIGE